MIGGDLILVVGGLGLLVLAGLVGWEHGRMAR